MNRGWFLMMVELLSERADHAVWTVDELCELARALGERNVMSARHVLGSLRMPVPALSADDLERVQREAHAAGLDGYLDRGYLVLEPDAAALAEQEFYELQDQIHDACDHLGDAPWLRRLRERGGFVRERLLHLARGA
jgi:hypothetical protein